MAELVVVFIDDLSATENPWGPQRTTSNTATNSRGTGWDCLIHCYISSRFNKVQYTTIGQRFLTWQWVRATCMYCKPWSDLGGGGGGREGLQSPLFFLHFFSIFWSELFLECYCAIATAMYLGCGFGATLHSPGILLAVSGSTLVTTESLVWCSVYYGDERYVYSQNLSVCIRLTYHIFTPSPTFFVFSLYDKFLVP